jgi:hypothetical protein
MAALATGTVRRAEADGEVAVGIRETNAPVETTERLEVVCEVTNRGSAATEVDLSLVVGHDPETVDESSVAVDPDSSETLSLGYETARVERTQEFPVRIEANGSRDERPVTVLGSDDSGDLAAIRPPGDDLEIRPGTAILFEIAAGNPLEPSDVEWEADDELAGDLALASDYTYATGAGAYLAEPDTAGVYNVRATASTEAGQSTHQWSLRVDDDGRQPPTVETLTTEPGPDAVVGADDTVEITVEAATSEGALEQVIWQEGQNHTVVDVDDLDGSRDSATLATTDPGWIGAGYPTIARVVCADGRTSDLAVSDGPEIRPSFSVAIVGTNAPVEGGETLEVAVDVENTGSMMMTGETTQEIDLVVGRDPERVDTASVTVSPGATERTTLAYETYPVARDDEFPIRVESADDADERTVTVSGTGE